MGATFEARELGRSARQKAENRMGTPTRDSRTLLARPPSEAATPTRATDSEAHRKPSRWRLFVQGSSLAASQRLTASVENFEADLEYRLDCTPELRDSPWEKAMRRQLALVHRHHDDGEVETAWRCFAPATCLELVKADKEALLRQAGELRREAKAKKLAAAWRSALILELVDPKEIESRLDGQLDEVRSRLVEATRQRNEDANNRHYKVGLIRGLRTLLVVVLLCCLALVLVLAATTEWNADLRDPSVGFVALVAVFGALGACLSAIQSLGHVGTGGRIPEHVASSFLTITRPALGAAAALGVYAITVSGALNLDFTDREAHLTVLALAFASGFSERFVVSAVGTATGESGTGKG